jgi:Biotin-protein ligase, N terminal
LHCAEFVELDGGAYLGFCAGAYYASRRVVFEEGTRAEVRGERELAFFPGTALGSVVPGYVPHADVSAVAAPVVFHVAAKLRSAAAPDAASAAASGCSTSMPCEVSSSGVLHANERPAQQAGACSQELETDSSAWRSADVWLGGGKSDWTLHCAHPPGINCLNSVQGLNSVSCRNGLSHEGEQLSDGASPVAAIWQCCHDYVNGAPCFLVDAHTKGDAHDSGIKAGLNVPDMLQRVRVLARYACTQRVSALKVSVGKGAAVLCASHPEWQVQEDAETTEIDAPAEGPSCSVRERQQVLLATWWAKLLGSHSANAEKRALLFQSLLCALRLEDFVR